MRFFHVYAGICQGTCKPFFVAGNQVGLIRPDVIKHLQRFPEVCLTVLHGLLPLPQKLLDTWTFFQKQ